MTSTWDALVERFTELEDITAVLKLAHWDQEVLMPPKGGPARARALATMQAIAHERLKDPALGELLRDLEEDDSLDQREKASIRVMRLDYDKATKVPEKLVRELAELEATAYQEWTEARPANDFKRLVPLLTRMIELKKEQADFVGWEHERYDALLDDYEPGMLTSDVEKMFSELETSLRPIVEPIFEAAGERPDFLSRTFDATEQDAYCRWLVQQVGFDISGGRLDSSPHPFTMEVSLGDVRQTIRSDPNMLMMSIYAAMHETGHALYEQGIPDDLRLMPVGRVPSLGMHESQSRLWENQVGRSRAFTDFQLPHLKERFPDQLKDVDADLFYAGVNYPSRTLIRVSADEVTYNLHVALRFELELAMFRDELDVKDLPDAWNAAMKKWVGITPPDDSDGVMQDMHWCIGALGYFPTYTLGTLYAAAIFEKARESITDLDEQLRAGNSATLLEWLHENVYHQAYLYTAKDLMNKVLGEEPTAKPFIAYLRNKFETLYDIKL
jgi:carboxypeptidase Taq